MRLFEAAGNLSKFVNESSLKVLGAGGAVWACFYAIPRELIKSYCADSDNGGVCSDESASKHLAVSLFLVSFVTANLAYRYFKPFQAADPNAYRNIQQGPPVV